MNAGVEQRDERLEGFEPDSRVALGEHVGAQRHGGADLADRQRLANARRVAPHEVALERLERIRRDLDFGKRSEARVDPVDRLVAVGVPIDDLARRADTRGRRRRDRHAFESVRDRRRARPA